MFLFIRKECDSLSKPAIVKGFSLRDSALCVNPFLSIFNFINDTDYCFSSRKSEYERVLFITQRRGAAEQRI